jgi:3D (Asp-Asp-Asp) domain-containing protein
MAPVDTRRGRAGTRPPWDARHCAAVAVRLLVGAALVLFAWKSSGCAGRPAPSPAPAPILEAAPSPPRHTFVATAYAITGTTASGVRTRPGIVAADPQVLPLGTRIRVLGAGRYSGVYIVADTGGAINGRRIDVYIPSRAEARRFGRRVVQVEVVDATEWSTSVGAQRHHNHAPRRRRRVERSGRALAARRQCDRSET